MLSYLLEGLRFSFNIPSHPEHEIHGIERGLGVFIGSKCIVGEGAGLGMPLGLDGDKAIFPGESITVHDKPFKRFRLNRASIKYLGRLKIEKIYKKARSLLAPIYIRDKTFRPIYTILMMGRTLMGVKSRYENIGDKGYVDIEYNIGENHVDVNVDASNLRCSRFLIANELSGKLFTKLVVDDEEVDDIPPWIEIKSGHATLISPKLKLLMGIKKPSSCRLFAGREVLGGRLDWAGFSIMPSVRRFSYRVWFESLD